MSGSDRLDPYVRQLLPVVLVHGLIGTLNDPDLLGELAPRTALAPDLLGYGQHTDRPTDSLLSQVDHLARVLDDAQLQRVHLVGHSVGGVVAVLFADRYPDRMASLVNVEGNFTLADAFWSARVARMSAEQFTELFANDAADPSRWLSEAGVQADERRIELARRWLTYQPASTIQATARAVIDATAQPVYLNTMRTLFHDLRVHLVAGERSRDAWDVPQWALGTARSCTVIPDTGHLMMLEDPTTFARTIAQLLTDETTSGVAQRPPPPSSQRICGGP